MLGLKSLSTLLLAGVAFATPISYFDAREAEADFPHFPSPSDNPFYRPAAIVPADAVWCDYKKPNYNQSSSSLEARGKCHSRPTSDQLLELAPGGPSGSAPEPDLDEDTLKQALGYVAHYINKKKKAADIKIISAGGALNVIFLHTRDTTHDVDFYNGRLTQREGELLTKGAAYAREKMPELPREWLNNRPTLFMPRDLRDTMTTEAFNQNDLIYNRPGLKIYAGVWQHQLIRKLDKYGGAGGRGKSYDITDAAAYLHRFLQNRGLQNVRESKILEWGRRYQTPVQAHAVEAMADRYYRMYRSHPIVWDVSGPQ